MDYRIEIGEAIVAGSSDAVIATDRKGLIRLWNPGAERIFGHRADEAVGQSLDLIIPERLRARHWEGFDKVMETGESRYGKGDILSVPALRKDGSTVSVEFTILSLKDAAGRIDGFVAVLRDATRHFETIKALKQKLAAG